MSLEKQIDAVLTDAKAGELRPPHGRRRSPRKKPMKPQSVKRRWREYDANVREAARQAAAASRPSDWPEGYPEPPRGFGWVAPDYCKYPDGYCDYPCERCKGGGKKRHGGGRIHSYIEGYMSAPPSPQYEHLRNAIVRHAGKSWSVDQVSGDEAYLRPLGNRYGEGCKTVKCRELKKAGGGKRRSAAVYGPRGGVTEVQSLLFPRSMWTEARAKAWAKRNGKLYGDVDVTDKFIRLRQADPDSFAQMRTKCLSRRRGTCTIKAIIGIRR